MRRSFWIGLAAIALGIPLGAVLLAQLWAGRIERRAEAAWERAGMPFDEFRARFPAAPDDDSARRLRDLAAPLGIRFVAPGERVQSLPVEQELRTYLASRLAGQPAAVPVALAEFRRQHAAELEALVAHLAGAEVPRWEQDLARDFELPVPSLLAQRQVSELLTLEALVHPAPAGRLLTALDKLAAGVRGRAELISLLVALGLDRQTLRLVRRLEDPPQALPAGLDSFDYRAALWRTWQTEAFIFWHYARRDGRLISLWDGRKRDFGKLARPFQRRFVRLCAADYSRALAEATVRARGQAPCLLPDERGERSGMARWNLIGEVGWRGLAQSEHTVLAVQLEVELTHRVLALRAQRGPDGSWPAQSAETASQVCPGTSWRYERDADGGAHLSWSRSEPKWLVDDLKFTATRPSS